MAPSCWFLLAQVVLFTVIDLLCCWRWLPSPAVSEEVWRYHQLYRWLPLAYLGASQLLVFLGYWHFFGPEWRR